MRATTHNRPYQGYPYLEPPVHDAPTIDPATANRWANLPRRQIGLPNRQTDVFVVMPNGEEVETRSESGLPQKPADPSPVVYIDVPESGGSLVTEGRDQESQRGFESSSYNVQNKRDPDAPVVYIDLPDETGSVTQTPQAQTAHEEPQYVQETIFFDPFENRRIEMNKEERRERGSDSEEDSVSTVSGQSARDRPNIRPSSLDLFGPGTSGMSSTPQGSSSTVPPLMSKETLIYGQHNEDGFPMSPIPVSEFPEPPPAYAEIDQTSNPVVEVMGEEQRTQVILHRETASPITPMGIPNAHRKYLNCHHCGMRVHSLVVRENGTVTHVSALMCLLVCMLPIVAFIYCTDYLKIKNHYCPNCNKIIGYELPLSGNKIVYVN